MDNFERKSFKESDCEQVFCSHGPFWHLSTSGREQDAIFESDEDYSFGLTSSALALVEVNGFSGNKVKLLAYAIRENHIHEIVAGSQESCIEYFKCRKRRLRRYFAQTGKAVDLSNFNCNLVEIVSLNNLRNEILFVNNTNYEEECLCDFYSRYNSEFETCCNSGRYYFSFIRDLDSLPSINSLSFIQRRDITKSDCYVYPDWYKLNDDRLYPPSFCDFGLGEKLFCNAKQYYETLYPVDEPSGSYTRKPRLLDFLKKRIFAYK